MPMPHVGIDFLACQVIKPNTETAAMRISEVIE